MRSATPPVTVSVCGVSPVGPSPLVPLPSDVSTTAADPLAGAGRGLFIISRIMDELRLHCDGGLEVEMVKRAVPRR